MDVVPGLTPTSRKLRAAVRTVNRAPAGPEFRRASVPALRVRVRAARGRRGRTWSVDRVFNATMLCAQKSFSARIGRYVRESAPATANFFEPLLVLVDAMGSNLRRHLFDHRYRFMACSSEAADGGPQVRVPES